MVAWWSLPVVALVAALVGFVCGVLAAARRRGDLNREIRELEAALARRPAPATHRRE